MGLVALFFAAMLVFGIFRSPGLAVTLAGFVIFVFGLGPMFQITDFHPYTLIAIIQSLNSMPAIPIGIGLMGLGRLVTLAERRENAPPER
jgi:hypothetical protein